MKLKFIKLLDRDGLSLLINVNHIAAVRFDDDEQCIVVDTSDGSYLTTLSTFEDIEKSIINVTY